MASRIGYLRVPKDNKKVSLYGVIEICGVPVSISVVKNDDKTKTEKSPPYYIVSYGIKQDKPQAEQAQQPTQPQVQQPTTNNSFSDGSPIPEELPF